ncbi:MAG: SSI family serine proteinase inhibitor [Gaiellaceae bacterium]
MGSLARAALLLGLVAAAGCGSDGGSSEPAQPRYDLTVTFWPEGKSGASHTATLQCDPDGGTHPDAARACAALLANEDALAPVAGDVACTQIYGGDQVATLAGGGVDATFSRANGCEISRWDALAAVLELPD